MVLLSREKSKNEQRRHQTSGPAWSFLKWLNSNNASYRSVHRIMVARLYFVCAFFVHIIRNKSQQKLIKARTKARHSLTRAHAITLKRWQIVCSSWISSSLCVSVSFSHPHERPPARSLSAFLCVPLRMQQCYFCGFWFYLSFVFFYFVWAITQSVLARIYVYRVDKKKKLDAHGWSHNLSNV